MDPLMLDRGDFLSGFTVSLSVPGTASREADPAPRGGAVGYRTEWGHIVESIEHRQTHRGARLNIEWDFHLEETALPFLADQATDCPGTVRDFVAELAEYLVRRVTAGRPSPLPFLYVGDGLRETSAFAIAAEIPCEETKESEVRHWIWYAVVSRIVPELLWRIRLLKDGVDGARVEAASARH